MLPTDPATWLSTVLATHFAEHAGEPGAGVPLTPDALLADDAHALRASHRKLVEEGASPQAAATYLAGWFAGAAAEVVGLMLARAGAGLPAGHAWARTSGAVVAADRAAVREGAIAGLVAFSEPIVDACRGLARVSRTGLWDEVADALALVFRHGTDVTQEMLDELTAATSIPGTPWKARPRLGWAHSDVLGRVHIGQKGGCCLYFTCRKQHVEPDRSDWDAAQLAYHERFGHRSGEKHYCSTCKFRDPADVAARRTYWQELCHALR